MKLTFSRRLAALLLALVMIVPLLVSCKKDPTGGNEGSNQQGTQSDEDLPLVINNYNGDTISIAVCGNSNIMTVEETADTLDAAVFHRNSRVADLYNVKFEFPDITTDNNGFHGSVDASILSGADDYQLVGNYTNTMAYHTMSTNYYQNMLDLPYLSFEEEWWPGEFMKNAKIGNKLYIAVGNMESSYYDLFTAVLFNKELASNYPIDDLYQLVRDHKWTLDKLIEYTDMADIDLDGDGMMDPLVDQFGLAIHRSYPVDGFVTAFEIKLTDWDENGLPVLLPVSERYVEVGDKLDSFIHGQSVRYNIEKSGTPDYTFIEGRALFEANRMWTVAAYREMEQDFGILPYPLWDENQEKYRSFSDVENATSYAIPITTNGARAANILEALSYFGHEIVLPAYYDKSLKGRSTRDKESGEMLDIIYDNISYEFIQIYSADFYPAPNQLLRIALWEDSKVAREYARNRSMYNVKMKQLIKMLDVEGEYE